MAYIADYCRKIGHIFDSNIIRLTALTGAAATEIKGGTTHGECKMGPNGKITSEEILLWKNTRLLVVDEISFGSHDAFLGKLSKNLQRLTEDKSQPYGSMPIVFIGDFFQLEPVSHDEIYRHTGTELWEAGLNMLVELKGEWRFKKCEQLRRAFSEFRLMGLTPNNRKIFNSRLVGSVIDGVKLELPDIRKTKVAVWTNKLKEHYNDIIFMDHLQRNHSRNEEDEVPKYTVIIKSDPSHSHNGRKFTTRERRTFFSKCSESQTFYAGSSSKRIAPMLKCYRKCQMMGIENVDVGGGIANGTTALFQHIKLKPGKECHKVCYNGYWVWAANAEDIEFMKLEWTKDSTFQGTFTIVPHSTSCISHIKVKEFGRTETLKWYTKVYQFRVTINDATTGHKLQGKSVDNIIVGQYATCRNWLYVVLSRVRTLKGLYLLEPLPATGETAPLPELTAMLTRFRANGKIAYNGDGPKTATIRSSRILSSFKLRCEARRAQMEREEEERERREAVPVP